MQQEPESGQPANPEGQQVWEEEFFIPDLCTPQSLFFIVVITELLVCVLVLDDAGLTDFSWGQLGLTSLFIQWVVLIATGVLCQARPHLKALPLIPAMVIALGLVLGVTFVISLGSQWLFAADGQEGAFDWSIIGRNVLIGAIISGLAFRYLYLQHRLLVQEQAELTSRIQALQSRIRPHFLFNSMNIIAGLIHVDPDIAEEVVEDLSILFRASLDETTARPVALEDEIALCEKYVHIESLRLEDRLEVQWTISVDPKTVTIPMLTLQPLLENAIYHGIQPRPEGGVVTIELFEQDEMFCIRVTNPVSIEHNRHADGNRMALENIRHRLNAIYGSDAVLTTATRESRYETSISYRIT